MVELTRSFKDSEQEENGRQEEQEERGNEQERGAPFLDPVIIINMRR